jgi:hypothetical protein
VKAIEEKMVKEKMTKDSLWDQTPLRSREILISIIDDEEQLINALIAEDNCAHDKLFSIKTFRV